MKKLPVRSQTVEALQNTSYEYAQIQLTMTELEKNQV